MEYRLGLLEISRGSLGGDGKPWCVGTEVDNDRDVLPCDLISRQLNVPDAKRIILSTTPFVPASPSRRYSTS